MSRTITTHYDNLKVARTAPPAVIKAAYRALAQQYHPDVNKDPDSARVMQLINRAYEVLSDPGLRAEHDAWIREQERSYTTGPAAGAEWAYTPPRQPSQASAPPPQSAQAPAAAPKHQQPSRHDDVASPASRAIGVLMLIGVIAFVASLANMMFTSNSTVGPEYSYQLPTETEAHKARIKRLEDLALRTEQVLHDNSQEVARRNQSPADPIAQHIGKARVPYVSAYIQDEPFLRSDGLSSVTIDNTQNDSDVLVKLYSLDSHPALPVRTFYIPKSGRFKVSDVTAGSYDVRYLDGSTGALAKSEPFALAERQTDSGIEYDNMSMTLYKVVDGNMQTERISESEF